MRFEPCPAVHLAWIGEDLVILNLVDGQYLCLPGFASVAVRLETGDLDAADPDALDDLVAAGLIQTACAPRVVLAADLVMPPKADLIDRTPTSPDARAIAAMARAFSVVVRRFFGRPLGAIVAAAARARPPTSRSDPAALARRAASFAAMLPWVPLQGECLFRSFMLLAFLRSGGFDARWVFGVRTWPFQAHCWLQCGALVLDDAADRVAAFTPILVV
jgi:hypothetical protein